MKILFVITNIDGLHEVPYSFGLSSIAAYAESKGHESKTVGIVTNEDWDDFRMEVHSFAPQVVGFTSVSSQFNAVCKAAEMVKSINENIVTVCGGVHITLNPGAIMATNRIDYMFMGESEVAFGDFIDALEKGNDIHQINNLIYRGGDAYKNNALNPLITNLDELPFPKKDHFFKRFIVQNGHAPFFFSRGCPFSCSYCSNKSLAKVYGLKANTPRYRSVENALQEIKEARKQHDFQKIWFLDDTFGLDKTWRDEFCEEYKREIGLPFICLLRVNIVNEKFIRELKGAGCYRIQFGIESGNEYIRNEVMKRNISTEQITRAFDLCRKYGLETASLNLIGLPGETEEMIWDTIKINRRIKPTSSYANIFFPYRGTPLGDWCFENNWVDEKRFKMPTKERRETVLNFPEDHMQKLQYFQEKWEVLVDPYNVMKRGKNMLRKYPSVFNRAKKVYRMFKN
jgi:anaerobic magnesium-protoporphyrin IX monomethyl ester cyclase